MKRSPHTPRVLALYPTTRGFSFVLFESPLSPFDWGVRTITDANKNEGVLSAVENLLERYVPDALVIEDVSSWESRRTSRVRRLYARIAELASAKGYALYAYDKSAIRHTFSPFAATRKHDIARVIALHIDCLAPKLPPKRKIWLPQDPRQSLFDAAALGLTFYALHGDTWAQDSHTP